MRVKLDLLSNKIREKVTKDDDEVSDDGRSRSTTTRTRSASRSPSGATCSSS